MSSQSTDDASTASIEPTQFLSIHVSKAPAVVSWTDEQSQSQCLSHDPSGHDNVFFDVQCDAQSNTALFKITANVAYKGKRNRSNIYLHIYPRWIHSLSIVSNDEIAPARLGTSVYTLEFVLSARASLIVPKGDWVPKNEVAQSALALMEALSSQTSFRVVFPSKSIATDRLAALCEKASSSGCLKTMADAANITKLYGGMGGKIFERAPPHVDMQNVFGQSGATENPPAYGDVGDSPPPLLSQGNKRRRIDSDVSAGDVNHEKSSLEEICRHGFAELSRRFERIEKSLGDLTSRLDRVEQLVREGRPDDQHTSTVGSRIDIVEERVIGMEKKLQTGLSDLAHDVENQLHDVRQEFNETITVRVDDEVGIAQSQLEDFVKDELRNAAFEVEEVVREKLRDALS